MRDPKMQMRDVLLKFFISGIPEARYFWFFITFVWNMFIYFKHSQINQKPLKTDRLRETSCMLYKRHPYSDVQCCINIHLVSFKITKLLVTCSITGTVAAMTLFSLGLPSSQGPVNVNCEVCKINHFQHAVNWTFRERPCVEDSHKSPQIWHRSVVSYCISNRMSVYWDFDSTSGINESCSKF